MNNTLAVQMPADTLDPKEQMTRLAEMYKRIMQARSKALNAGMDAIHDQLCEVSDEIGRRQKTLLESHPELILMAFE